MYWSLDCQSQYWIEGGRQEIEDGRARDREAKRRYFEARQNMSDTNVAEAGVRNPPAEKVGGAEVCSRARKT